jgi:hypothetical protein
MGKKVGEFAVHGILDENGEPHSFLPGTEPPAWAVKQMGDHCFEGGEDLFNEDGALAPVIHHDAVLPDPRGGGESSDGPPPKAGKGSGEDKWRAYAEEQGVDVSDAEGRDEIIAALEEADVPVE